MSLSIYSSAYNLKKMSFSWKDTLRNWIVFLGYSGEIVIAVNTSEDETPKLLRDFLTSQVMLPSQVTFKIIEASIDYQDPEFDGKLKALALSNCIHPYCMLFDMDEVLIPTQKPLWLDLTRELEMYKNIDAFLVPVVDIAGDNQHFKSIGAKWYIHRNDPNITRGVHKAAYREDGSINKNLSDTTEIIYKDSREIVRARQLLMASSLPPYIAISYLESGQLPFVVHLGWANYEQKIRQAAFWRPVWDNRDKHSQENTLTMQDLEKIPRFRHALPPWEVLS